MNAADLPDETLFEGALKCQTPSERAAYLNHNCAGRPELRQRLERLLEAHERSGRFLEPADRPTLKLDLAPQEAPGTVIGRYKLLQRIGEGGCGIVYMAEQSEPVRRRVALKVIKLGMDTKSVIARFEAERQALALMDHPNIAKVLDAGATEAGRPYFVMELVRGVRITDFCDEAKLSTRERLDLFIQVCHAVQHAHQKGIIHRDIKPSNILVSVNDGVPIPKVIDFGIAKATNQQQLTDKTLFTAFEQFIGTPAYMSPEQAVMTSLDIDTRSDIYALGVLLYELLTGQTPFDAKELMQAGLDEVRRTIREVEPQRPSTRLSTMIGAELTSIARHRHSEPAKLATLIRGDLDWIVMKALEKDRSRRYETANGLASDIRRHLNNEPIVARPPSAAYRFQKMVRRNKVAFAATVAVLGTLLLGVAASTWQAIRATKAERQQSALRREAEAARGAEANQRAVAEQRVYDSLLREARALRLARRVGYREEAFAALSKAAALGGVQKNLEEIRREAMLSMGDFVGFAPVTRTNLIPGFKNGPLRLSPSGLTVVYELWSREKKKDALCIRSVRGDKDLATMVTESIIQEYDFASDDQFIVLYLPRTELEKGRSGGYQGAEIGVWMAQHDGSWREVSRTPIPGAYSLVTGQGQIWVAVDDQAAGKVRFLDFHDGKSRLEIEVSKASKEPARFLHSRAEFLAIQTSDFLTDGKTEVSIWDLKASREIRRCTLENSENVFGLSSGAEHLVTVIEDRNLLVVYETKTMHPLERIQDVWLVGSMRPGLMANRNVFALPSIGQRVTRLIDFSRQDSVMLDEPDIVWDARFTEDGRSLLTAGPDHARRYDLAAPREIQFLSPNAYGGGTVFHPDGVRIATVGYDNMLRLWSSDSGRLILQKKITPWETLAFSPIGKWLIAPSWGTQEVRFFDSDTVELVLTLGSDAFGGVQSAVMTKDGRYLLAATRTEKDIARILTSDRKDLGSLLVWELEYSENRTKLTGARLVRRLEGKYGSLAVLGSSTQMAFLDFDLMPAAYLWDFTQEEPPRKLKISPRWSYQNLAPTLDGRRLWMLNAEGGLVCVDVATGDTVKSLAGPPRAPGTPGGDISLSPDGTRLAVPSPVDPIVEIVDTETGRTVYTLPQRTGSPTVPTWSPDSQRILVASSKGDITIWKLPEVDRILAELGLNPPKD